MDKKNIYPVVVLIAGFALACLGFVEIVDEFWSGMGSALAVMGIIRLLRYYRLKKNESYREKMETAVTDERNQFIRMKAWSWAGYLFIMVSAIATIIFRILGQDLLSQFASGAVCLMLVLYWVSYFVLKKKY